VIFFIGKHQQVCCGELPYCSYMLEGVWLSGDPEGSFMGDKHAGYPNTCYLSDYSFASYSDLVSTCACYKSRHLFSWCIQEEIFDVMTLENRTDTLSQ
jgi:hypothetical protein